MDTGVPVDRIFCRGIPIHPDLATVPDPSDIAQARKTYGLFPGRPTVLLMGGSRGVGLKQNLLRELEQLPDPINILAPAGTNPAALRALRSWAGRSSHRVVPLEFSDDIRMLYALADLAITKPGGLTLAECLAVGLPMVIQHALPGQERHNLEYVQRFGLAEIGSTPADVVGRVQSLLSNPGRRRDLSVRLKAHSKPHSALAIVDQILSELNPESLSCSSRSAEPLTPPLLSSPTGY